MLHLGAEAPKSKEYKSTFVNNIFSTAHLFENLPNIPKRIVFTSTVSVYESNNEPINEDTKLSTDNMYGLSKVFCENYIEDYANQNNVELSILRLGSVYGPGEENYDKIVGNFIKTMANNTEIKLQSDGRELRNLVFVDDVATCISDIALGKIGATGIVNVVSSNSVSVFEIAMLAKKICNSDGDIIIQNNGIGRNDLYDSQKIKQIMRSRSETSIEEGIRQTYYYYKENGLI